MRKVLALCGRTAGRRGSSPSGVDGILLSCCQRGRACSGLPATTLAPQAMGFCGRIIIGLEETRSHGGSVLF